MAGIQPVTSDVVGRQPGHRPLQVLRRTGQHGVGAVVGRHGQPRELVGAALDPVGVGERGDHPTAGGQTAEQSAALGEQQRAVLEAEHAGDTGRRVLTDAVAEHHVRFEPPRLPESGQTHLHREQRGLGVRGVTQRVIAVSAENDVQQGLFEYAVDRGRTPAHRLPEHRLGLEQLPGHPDVLAALTREQPRRLRRVTAFPPHQTRCRPIVDERIEQFAGGRRRIHHQGGAVLEVRSPRPGGEAHVRHVGVRVRRQPVAVSVSRLDQRRGRACRQGQHGEASVVGHLRDRARRRGRRPTGASSTMTCAFVPENPNPLIPATRGRSLRVHGTASSTTRTGSRSQGMCGDGILEIQVFRQLTRVRATG